MVFMKGKYFMWYSVRTSMRHFKDPDHPEFIPLSKKLKKNP